MCQTAIKNFPGRRIRTDFSDGDSDLEEQFYILRKFWYPAVLTENFFMDNLQNRDYLLSEEGITSIVYTSNLLRRSSRMLLEELDKGGRTGEIEPVGDLLDSQVCGLEKHLRFNQYRLVQPLKDRSPGCLLYSCGKILRCDVKFVCIELYGPVFLIIYGKQVEELV